MKKFIPVAIIGAGFLIAVFILSVGRVHGPSMQPNITDGYYFQDYVSYWFRQPVRGEIVVLKSPIDDRMFVKRIVGLPGERVSIQDSVITVFNSFYPEGMKLGESYLRYSWAGDFLCRPVYNLTSNEYLVLGDNRGNSLDSRVFGPIDIKSITAHVIVRL